MVDRSRRRVADAAAILAAAAPHVAPLQDAPLHRRSARGQLDSDEKRSQDFALQSSYRRRSRSRRNGSSLFLSFLLAPAPSFSDN